MRSKGQLSLEFLLLLTLYLATAIGVLKLYDTTVDIVAKGNMRVAATALRSLARAAEVTRTFTARYILPPLCAWSCPEGKVFLKCKKSSTTLTLNCVEGEGNCMVISKEGEKVYAEPCLSS